MGRFKDLKEDYAKSAGCTSRTLKETRNGTFVHTLSYRSGMDLAPKNKRRFINRLETTVLY